MRYLLDTHSFLWWIFKDERLSDKAVKTISNSKTTLYWSAASSWEVSIKYYLGKLELGDPPDKIIPSQLRLNNVLSLPIADHHSFLAGSLKQRHKDPFDRMLIAQAMTEHLVLITGDPVFKEYDVRCLW
jgi:PIN domain nuclease of toxin-antitoxin system